MVKTWDVVVSVHKDGTLSFLSLVFVHIKRPHLLPVTEWPSWSLYSS